MTTTATTAPRWIDTADVAKLVRTELRDAFPGVKFSVRKSRGGSIDVHCPADGPAWSEVHAVTSIYGSRRTDGGYTHHWLCPDHGVTVATIADCWGRTDYDACCAKAEDIVMVADYVLTHRA